MPFKYSVCNGGDVKVKEADEITYFNGFIEKYRGEIRPFWVAQSLVFLPIGGVNLYSCGTNIWVKEM